ncbi:MAG: iron-sulfur cluster repair di-iron protein, ric [Bacillota bacterium]|nr:iron-sulfur cluster repair di-iron protein, ric [Bacillota bacterium]
MNQEIIKELDKILPVVDRVHGDHHPELHKVLELYNTLKENASKEVFEKLREVTTDYTIPSDACPTYEKTYRLLEALEKDSQ